MASSSNVDCLIYTDNLLFSVATFLTDPVLSIALSIRLWDTGSHLNLLY